MGSEKPSTRLRARIHLPCSAVLLEAECTENSKYIPSLGHRTWDARAEGAEQAYMYLAYREQCINGTLADASQAELDCSKTLPTLSAPRITSNCTVALVSLSI